MLSWNPSAASADAGGLIDSHNISFVDQTQPAATAWEGNADFDASPRWTVWAGAIFLQRSRPRFESLLTDGADELLNARSFNFQPQGGPDLNAIRHGDVVDIDFRYFQVNQMSSGTTIFPAGEVDFLLADIFTVDSAQIDAAYVTSLQSVEINLRRNVSQRLTLLAGFRHITLRDDLAFRLEDDIDLGPLSLHLNGFNRLYGAQFGADAILWNWGRFELQSALKAGVYGNTAEGGLGLRALGFLEASIGKGKQHTAFVGDWNFTGLFRLNDFWAIRAGYQLLWISGVALGSEQFSMFATSLPDFVTANTSGDLFLHGALVSLQANW
jgi:hypothetical protein